MTALPRRVKMGVGLVKMSVAFVMIGVGLRNMDVSLVNMGVGLVMPETSHVMSETGLVMPETDLVMSESCLVMALSRTCHGLVKSDHGPVRNLSWPCLTSAGLVRTLSRACQDLVPSNDGLATNEGGLVHTTTSLLNMGYDGFVKMGGLVKMGVDDLVRTALMLAFEDLFGKIRSEVEFQPTTTFLISYNTPMETHHTNWRGEDGSWACLHG